MPHCRRLKGKGLLSSLKSVYGFLHKYQPLSKIAGLAGLIPHPYAKIASGIGAPLLKMAGLGKKKYKHKGKSNKSKMAYVRSFKK